MDTEKSSSPLSLWLSLTYLKTVITTVSQSPFFSRLNNPSSVNLLHRSSVFSPSLPFPAGFSFTKPPSRCLPSATSMVLSELQLMVLWHCCGTPVNNSHMPWTPSPEVTDIAVAPQSITPACPEPHHQKLSTHHQLNHTRQDSKLKYGEVKYQKSAQANPWHERLFFSCSA